MQEKQTFESAITELESILEKLEGQDTTLEEAMQLFEKGVALSDDCSKLLEQAQQKVSILIEKDAKMVKKEFEPNEK